MSGAILVISGPSGAGKSSLLKEIIEELGECYFSISSTTRAMRDGEIDGLHYHFIKEDEFKQDIENEHFLEYAIVHGNYYGTSIKPVREALKAGKLVIFDIDVQGNATILNRLGDITTSVFIAPPKLSILQERLQNRGSDTKDVIDRRIEMAKREIQRVSEYDFLVINDDFDTAAKKLKKIAQVARLKVTEQEINEFVRNWEDI